MSELVNNLLPLRREFIPIGNDKYNETDNENKMRILQFNILADGLSGLCDGYGDFSRITKEDIIWENRKTKLLHEIIQYNPDIITLQECDHYYDFFLPQLSG